MRKLSNGRPARRDASDTASSAIFWIVNFALMGSALKLGVDAIPP